MPEKLIGKQYYFPGNTGYENTIKKYHEWCRNYKNKLLEANRKENKE
jgi:replication-associated recombination protein RarA